jgi:ATP-dependent DNA helicase RecG
MVTVFSDSLGNNDTDNGTDNDTDSRLREILIIINQNERVTTRELARLCSVSQSTIKRDIEKLKKQKRLKRVGKEKDGYWFIIEP